MSYPEILQYLRYALWRHHIADDQGEAIISSIAGLMRRYTPLEILAEYERERYLPVVEDREASKAMP
ncbi:hypothetical protein ACFQ5J_08890 [Lacticaseibacillus baoqingensis]|uniref:Uncharacterized protein n=1 Tax=Lacticaseibacillus baoqingensis TaxID=2486013 RepID=A0ABW4E921_9LACO|nr:hypothetical protein [Lacticaseibacillus baoqingensis]